MKLPACREYSVNVSIVVLSSSRSSRQTGNTQSCAVKGQGQGRKEEELTCGIGPDGGDTRPRGYLPGKRSSTSSGPAPNRQERAAEEGSGLAEVLVHGPARARAQNCQWAILGRAWMPSEGI